MIPFPEKFVTAAMIVWLILSLFSYKKESLTKNRLLWLLPFFYLLYFSGLFTSESVSWKFIEYKLSMLLFPLLFFLHNYDVERRKKIWKAFIWGLCISGLLCLFLALYNSMNMQNGELIFQANVLKDRNFFESILYGGNYFFGKHLSVFHQTIYFALYFTFGMTALLFHSELFKKSTRLLLFLFFTLLVFLISNKASFIALALTVVVWISTAKINRAKKTIGFVIGLSTILALIMINPRAKESIKNLEEGKLGIDKNARYGFGPRLLSWDAALSLIKERPIIGYGLGDAQTKLNETYARKDYKEPLKNSFNAHNLWLQTWIENGIFAVLLLFVIFAILFHKSSSPQLNKGFILCLVLILLMNSLFESVFSRFSGVSFFAFAICFLFTYPSITKETHQAHET